jgi:hypothetical protein
MTVVEIRPHRLNGRKVFETLGVEHKVSHFPELRFVVSVERHEAEHSRSCLFCVTVSQLYTPDSDPLWLY